MKIIFVLPSLKAGGAERVISFLAKKINNKKFDVLLIVVGFEKDAVYDVQGISVSYLNKTRVLKSVFSVFKIIQKEKPTIVFGSIGHVNLILGFFNLIFRKVNFIIREASVISKMDMFVKQKKTIPNWMIRFLYNRMEKVVCQSKDMKNDMKNNLGIKESKLMVINNPITQVFTGNRNIKNEALIKFITIGRLSEEKGYERILNGVSKIKDYTFNYTIIGSGVLEEKIKKQVKKLNLCDVVTFIPFTKEVLRYLNNHDYFIQGSYVEGFSNALLESCSVGTPVIAYDCPGGTKEIIEDKVNGYLVKNEKEFTVLIKNLHKSEVIKGEKVKKSVFDKFSEEKILNQYQSLFLSMECK